MWFVVNPNSPLEFMTFDFRHSVEVDGIEIGSPGTIFRDGKPIARNDAILNGSQAVSILQKAGVPGFPTKNAAKEVAVKSGLMTWKYLQVFELTNQYAQIQPTSCNNTWQGMH
ncbi:hypothetical protein [Halomonas sp. HAL1]|uniref:hypothetical protein n=1 Tax=Halomonadaceae TaxID=28256 RepID=UPI00022D2772|nr:hypothetical protein [Halomonas sp. HAL1]EHA15278.1 hypothetical protein HAL1_12204 [Halomonas sp. HAL1]WKV95061.1 hypothetical protein Q3Y66_20425 [Halomonas sp. HAL1]